MTAFDKFARRGSRVFLPSHSKVAEPIVRSILAGKLSIGTEMDLQDEIYARTHSLELTAMARPIWQHFTERTALADWNTDVLKTEENN